MFHTQAIVLKKRTMRNYDRSVTLFTHSKGKVEAFVRGALRPKSKLAPHLEPPGLVEVDIAFGKNMNHIAGAYLTKSFPSLRRDVASREVFQKLVHSVHLFTRENHTDNPIFQLLLGWIEKLESHIDENTPERNQHVTPIFLWQLVAALGHSPQLSHCVIQGHELTEPAVMSLSHGGVACERCLPEGKNLPHLTPANLSRLRYFLQTESRQQDLSVLNQETLQMITDWVIWYAPEHVQPFSIKTLQRYLKSAK